WTHVLHMLPVMLLAQLVVRVLHAWLMGEWSGWDWAGAVLLTAALWPLADSGPFLPPRRHDETDSGSPRTERRPCSHSRKPPTSNASGCWSAPWWPAYWPHCC